MDKWVVINWYNARKPQLLKYLNEYFAILRIIDCQYFFIFYSSKDSFPSTFLFYFNHSLFIVHMFYLPFSFIVSFTRPSLVAQMAKCLPAMRETWVWSPGREDPLEKEMATHSSTLAGEFHGQSLAGYSSWDGTESDMTERLTLSLIQYGQSF